MTYVLAQLSDLHLDDPTSRQQFLACLDLAIAQKPDGLLLTGDLVNNGQKLGYDWLLQTLTKTAIPFVATLGNHDVTFEKNSHLPFDQREFIAIKQDDRFEDFVVMTLGTWQIIALNSAVNGQIYGKISAEILDKLNNHLKNTTCPTLIACHHPPISVGTAWIDEFKLQNHKQFLNIINQYPHIKALLCGHVHQAQTLALGDIMLYTCPATARQFLPNCTHFSLDSKPAGIRMFYLDKKIKSKVIRL